MAGDLNGVAALYAHPLIVYRPDGIVIEKTPADTVVALADRLLSVRAGGADHITITLDQTGTLQNDRQPFDVTWLFKDARGAILGESQLRYFCRLNGDQVQIELIDIMHAFRSRAIPMANAANH